MNTDSINAIIQTFELFGHGVEKVMIWYKNDMIVTHYIDKKGRHKRESSDGRNDTLGGMPVKGQYMPYYGIIVWHGEKSTDTFHIILKNVAKVGFIGANNKPIWVYKGE